MVFLQNYFLSRVNEHQDSHRAGAISRLEDKRNISTRVLWKREKEPKKVGQ